MGSFWDSFAVYNPRKHASSDNRGGGHMNIGSSNAQWAYSKEYRPAEKEKLLAQQEMLEARRNSIESQRSQESADADSYSKTTEGTWVDVSNLTQGEFEKIYKGLHKGEPNNQVNF